MRRLLLLSLLLAACRSEPSSATRGEDGAPVTARADSGLVLDSSGSAVLLDSAFFGAAACCTFANVSPAMDVKTLAEGQATHFYTDFEAASRADCVRPAATEAVRVQADGVDKTAFVVMPPDSLMAVEVVRFDNGHTATVAHSGCESVVLALRLTASGADDVDDAARRAFVARELRALAAVSTLPIALRPVADALDRGPLPDGGQLDELTTVTLDGHGTLPGGHRYADLTVRYGPL